MRRIWALLAALAAAPAGAAGVEEVGRIVLSAPDPAFGGLSGIEVDAAGSAVTLVGDRGILATLTLLREAGQIAAHTPPGITPLRKRDGTPVSGHTSDAEALAIGPDGRLWVSYEGVVRVAGYRDRSARTDPLLTCPGFDGLQGNSGLEALAIAPDGTLFAIPERSGAWGRPFPVFRLREGTCDAALRLPRSGPFLVTGADFGPDGRLYIVERHFALLGFQTRIRRFAVGEDGLSGEETLVETATGHWGNMEGIAAWRDAEGRTRLLLVADDNFSALQSNLLVELRVTE